MKLRRYISLFLVFYLFLLQVEIAFGHAHHADCVEDSDYNGLSVSSVEDGTCIACFAATLKPAGNLPKAFFQQPIYVKIANSPGFAAVLREYSAWQEKLSDRAPPVFSVVLS